MHLSNLQNNSISGYLPSLYGQYGQYGQSGSSGQASAAGSAAASNADQVSLSNAGLALSAANGSSSPQPGSSDFTQEAQYLGGLADQGLAALGLISPSQESGVQVSFDSLSYQVSSSTSASQTQQGGQVTSQFGQQQEATFTGEGKITTADGQTYDFDIEVQLDQSEQVGTQGGLTTANVPASTIPNLADGGAAGAGSNTSASSGAASTQSQGQGSDLINWNAILDQSKSLFELLDSLASSNQSSNQSPDQSSTQAASNAALGATSPSSSSASSPSSAGSAGTSSTSSNSANAEQPVAA